jgi:hypothetical protein
MMPPLPISSPVLQPPPRVARRSSLQFVDPIVIDNNNNGGGGLIIPAASQAAEVIAVNQQMEQSL